MSGFALKLLAVITMVIDHIGFLFFPESIVFRLIGRISFPLFAFLVAVGFTHTKNVHLYLRRLTFFAVISQIPFVYFETLAGNINPGLNILFTLTVGVLTLLCITKIKNIYAQIGIVLASLALAYFLPFSYGVYGVLCVLGSYLFLQSKKQGFITLTLLPFLETARLFILNIFFLQFFAALSIIPIYYYNGKQGYKISKWIFYWFYPLHLVILSALFLLLR